MPNPSHRTRPSSGLRPSSWPGSPGNSIRHVARDLGVFNESLRRWVIQAEIDRNDIAGLTTDEQAELTNCGVRTGRGWSERS